MKKVFWGFFFVYLNFNLTLNGHALNLLPDFVGYILLFQAAGALAGESGRFRTLRPFAAGMAVYTGILWVGDLLAVTGGSAAAAVSLFISWNVVQDVLEIERARGADLNGQSLRTSWFILLAAQIAGYAAGLLISGALALAAGLAALAGLIWFLVALWKCAGRYELLPPRDPGPELL